MPLTNFENRFFKVKIVGVHTGDEKISGGLAAINRLLEKNLRGVNYLAVDRHDRANLAACNAGHKFRLLNSDDEKILTDKLRDSDIIFIVADNVWENIKLVALTAHCAKKIGVPVIFIAGGNFDDAEDEIIFDALTKLPSKNFEFDACKVVQNFIEAVTLDGQPQPKLDIKTLAEVVKNSAATANATGKMPLSKPPEPPLNTPRLPKKILSPPRKFCSMSPLPPAISRSKRRKKFVIC